MDLISINTSEFEELGVNKLLLDEKIATRKSEQARKRMLIRRQIEEILDNRAIEQNLSIYYDCRDQD